jgi:hypothetical protein
MADHSEEFPQYSDWMGIAVQACSITLNQFKSLIAEKA